MALSKIDSNSVYSLVAPEASLGVFPVGAKWRQLDLNSYSDAGSSYESATRSVMDGNRRARKGKQSNKTVNFGYNSDLTKDNNLMQIASFMYGVPNEKPTSRSAFAGMTLTNKPTVAVTSITPTTVVLASAVTGIAADDIVILEDGKNDRTPLVVVSNTAGTITFEKLDATDTFAVHTDLANARVVKVGVRAAAGDMKLASTATRATLTTVAKDFTAMGLRAGEWVFVGGDATAHRFDSTAPFYARIESVTAKVLTFDTTTSPIVADVGTGKALALFFGTFIEDGKTRTSYTHTRFLGVAEDGEYLYETFTGCVPNELGITANESEFVNLDLGYMGLDHRPAKTTKAVFDANYADIVKQSSEDEAFHTASDVYRQRLAVNGLNMNTAAITSFVQESSITISNNISADTGNGVLGAFDFSVGDFTLTGSLTAYFIGLEAIEAIRCNCTVGMDLILATKNAGAVIDIPSFTLGGGIEVEANSSIKISLEQNAFASKFGFMLGWTNFSYLPDAAMPAGTSDCDC